MTDVEAIKERLDIISFIGDYIQLKKVGRNFKANCPFHGEKTPSFIVSGDRQIWHCFGACNEGGDVITFLMKIENIEFPEALRILAQKTGVALSQSYVSTETQKIRDQLLDLHRATARFYHYLLTDHPVGEFARNYLLKDRGISSKISETFLLGYAPNNWDTLLKYLEKKNYPAFVLSQSGLFVQKPAGRFYDRFRGRIMFPLFDHRDNILGFSGRSIVAGKDTTQAKYVNSPETPIYIKGNMLYGLNKTKNAIRKENNCLVVEGEFDLLSSFQEGVTNVVAIKGTAFTPYQAGLIKRFTDTITFSLDTDKAGLEALNRDAQVAENIGLNINVIIVPQGKDPHDCIRESPALWKKTITQKIPLYEYILAQAQKTYSLKNPYDKKKMVAEVLPWYVRIENEVVKAHFITLLARVIGVSEERIVREGEKLEKKGTVRSRSLLPQDQKNSHTHEEYLLSLLLQHPDFLQLSRFQTALNETLEYLENPAVIEIIKLLLSFLKETTSSKNATTGFIESLPAEIKPLADKAYLYDLSTLAKDQEKITREIETTVLQLKKKALRMKLSSLSTKLRSTTDEAQIDNLNAQFTKTKAELIKLANGRK